MTPALLGLALAGTIAASEPVACGPVEALPPDPAAAREYRAIAEAELARGADDTAAAAYRGAAARDPNDAASRAALARLCARGSPPDPFTEGVAHMDRGDYSRALQAFRASHGARPPPAAAALLEGICLYELGEDAAAEPLLRAAETAPAHRDAARLYLGLVRLRAGDAGDAAALFEAAGSTPALGRIAADLGRLARREGRLVVSVLAESAWDSNVTLAPAGVPDEADEAFGMTAAAVWRPRGAMGPFVRASAGFSEQRTLDAYDFAALDAGVGWRGRVRSVTLAAEADAATRSLGGERYLTAQRLLTSALIVRRGIGLSAAYAAQLEDYARAWSGYSGVVHRGELKASFPLGRAVRLALAYGGAIDDADAPELSFVEHGPRAELRVALGSRARIGMDAGATFRRYDAVDAALGVLRDDVRREAVGIAELDLGARLTARVALRAQRVTSTADALEYDKLVPSVGLLWVAGL
jgi:tetratricopeptide (TPR) repeat protein